MLLVCPSQSLALARSLQDCVPRCRQSVPHLDRCLPPLHPPPRRSCHLRELRWPPQVDRAAPLLSFVTVASPNIALRPQHLFPWPRRAGPNVERCPHGLVLQLQASSLEPVTKISHFTWRDQCGNRSWRCRSKIIFSLFFANMFPHALSLLPRHVRVRQRRTLHVQRCSKVRVVTNRLAGMAKIIGANINSDALCCLSLLLRWIPTLRETPLGKHTESLSDFDST